MFILWREAPPGSDTLARVEVLLFGPLQKEFGVRISGWGDMIHTDGRQRRV